jgi:hypothetical protein
MTNLRTALGAAVWMALNGLMLLAALEPIATGRSEQPQVAVWIVPGALA